MTIDTAKLNKVIGQVIKDIGATFHAPLVLIGEKLGLFKAMAGAGLITARELAERTGTFERDWGSGSPRWLPAAMWNMIRKAANIFLPRNRLLLLPTRQAPATWRRVQAATAAIRSEAKIADAFRTGRCGLA